MRIKHIDIPEDSIDYAVMEKSSKVVPSDIAWSDVGSFDALYDELPKDENGNTQTISQLITLSMGVNEKSQLLI